MLSLTKLYASVLDLTGSKSHWYTDIYPLHKNTSYVSIGYLVLMLQSIPKKVRDMNIPRIGYQLTSIY